MAEEIKRPGFFKRVLARMRHKYMLSILDESTMEKFLTLRLSRMNVIIVLVTISLLSVLFTLFIISVTPLKEYIPGYASVSQLKQVYINELRMDSLQNALNARDLYLKNLKETILQGKPSSEIDTSMLSNTTGTDYSNINLTHSLEDSLLRLEWEQREKTELIYNPNKPNQQGISSFIFFTPIRGRVVSGFNPKNRHYGIDLTGDKDAPVKATLDGIVVLSTWTYETGYVIAIQHSANLISVYKHNSVLLKQQGDVVQAGDPVAIIGNSGELTTGPHLHFELWYNLRPVNPADFIAF